MKGKILNFDVESSTGVIAAGNGERYTFNQAEWKSKKNPIANLLIDFSLSNEEVKDIYLDQNVTSEKNKIVAGVLAFFLGALGIHKFYLGCNKAGIIMLLCFFPGMFLFAIPTIIVSVIAFVEFIIYIMKSDEDFERIYVDNKKCWF